MRAGMEIRVSMDRLGFSECNRTYTTYMTYKTLIVKKESGVLQITLNRPEVRNAFNDTLIADLSKVFANEALEEDVRVILLSGTGDVFCAGGDIKWMKLSFNYTRDENYRDAKALSDMLEKINECPKPVVAKVHGAVMGGGLGLVSVCDYVLASEETFFSFSEVRLGLIPATIGPYVIAKIGESQARALFLSAKRFSTSRALEMGLIHQVAPSRNELEEKTIKLIQNILSSSPQALKVVKKFIHELKKKPGLEKSDYAAGVLADLRVTPEAQEGLTAFLEKRKPNWLK